MKPTPWLAAVTVISWGLLVMAISTNAVQTARLNRLEEGLKAVAEDMVKLDVALQTINARITKMQGGERL
jgi:hypothetical protein